MIEAPLLPQVIVLSHQHVFVNSFGIFHSVLEVEVVILNHAVEVVTE